MASPPVKRALMSVSDKQGLSEFARGLSGAGVEIYSTGGTRRHLEAAGIPVRDVSAYTEFPEMLDGRLKTLHPKIFGGILCRHDRAEDRDALEEHGILTFELVVVNLYPFQETIARPDVTLPEAIEQIDIGGPSLVRAAAKNHAFTTIVTSPEQYARVLDAIVRERATTPELRFSLAGQAFEHTALYDRAIANYFTGQCVAEFERLELLNFDRLDAGNEFERALDQVKNLQQLVADTERREVSEVDRLGAGNELERTKDWSNSVLARLQELKPVFVEYGGNAAEDFPPAISFGMYRKQTLRYGENPHQRGALYFEPGFRGVSLATAEQLTGKELSYNNLLDLDSAMGIVRALADASAVIVKHNNPCGAASAATLVEAFKNAYEGDPLSAFGGIIGFNRVVDAATAEAMAEPGRFIEAVVAPDFSEEALKILTTRPKWKASVRLLKVGPLTPSAPGWDYRRIDGGFLVQDRDVGGNVESDWKDVTENRPTEAQRDELRFAWDLVRHVKSNAIVLAKNRALIGVGAGQMSRVDSVEIAIKKAGPRSAQSVLASDAFFPFPDSIHAAAAAGITAVIQPGGSKQDPEVIAAANQHGMAMILTGRRHFKH